VKIYFDVLKNSGRLKKAVCVLFALSAVLFYFLVICIFSAQDGDETGNLSREVAEEVARVVVAVSGEHTEKDIFSLAEFFEHPLRKLAHFSEYAVLGGLFCGCFLPVMGEIRLRTAEQISKLPVQKRNKNGLIRSCGLYLKCIITVMIFAICDEIHQYFVPGRLASVWDVLLDTSGCALMCLILYLLCDRRSRKAAGVRKISLRKQKGSGIK
jgi:VanZ family protein